MITYANQKIVHVNKSELKGNYLSVGNAEWKKAYKMLNASAFALYLYLASNKDGFDLALSQKAVENDLGFKKATYHRAVGELEEKGYLKLKQGNIFDFYPYTTMSLTDETSIMDETVSEMRQSCLTDEAKLSHGRNKIVSRMSREITNITNKSNLTKEDANAESANALKREEKEIKKPEKKKSSKKSNRDISDLTNEEKQEILTHFKSGDMKYPEMYRKYNLKFNSLSKEIILGFEDDLVKEKNQKRKEKEKKEEETIKTEFGISDEESKELYHYLLGDITFLASNLKLYLTDVFENKYDAKELLTFLRENEYARDEYYEEYIPKTPMAYYKKETGKIYKCYSEYLEDCFENKNDVYDFALACKAS